MASKVCSFPSPQVKAFAAVVAEKGDFIEDELRIKNQDPLMWFLNKPESTEYKTFRALVAEIKSDNKTHMMAYNQAPPPPPPPPIVIKKEFKTEPGLLGASPSSYSNFIKAEPETLPSQSSRPSSYSNFVKSEPSSTTTSASPPSFDNFVKSEPGLDSLAPAATFNTFEKSEPFAQSKVPSSSLKREAATFDGEEETEQERRDRKRRSRWGPQEQATDIPPVGMVAVSPGVMGQSCCKAINKINRVIWNLSAYSFIACYNSNLQIMYLHYIRKE